MMHQNQKMSYTGWLIISVFAMTGLWGCTTPQKQTQIPPPSDPVYYAASDTRPAQTEGSLWVETGTLNDMFINPKARNVGDIVTIKIVESAKATNSASTNTGKSSAISLGMDKFLGMETGFPKPDSTFNPFGRIEGSMSNKFDGKGATSRSGDLTAYITAKVVDVLPNGNLAIAGSRDVAVNNEKQLIVLTGTIRQRDISSENVILSTYISDARISYSGKGDVNDGQRQGWMARFLNVISPF
ncbi:MAG: flagellar basal body L-ring protein FlgH [Desulfatirhabdiaceae bacterium]